MYQLKEIKIIKKDNNMNIKTSWKEVSIADFIKLNDINTNETLNDIEKNVKTLSIISGESEDSLFNLTPSQLSSVLSKLEWMQEAPETDDIVYDFNMSGIKLTFDKDICNMTTKQYMNIVELNKNQTKPLSNLHFILASLATVESEDKDLNVPEFILNNFNIIDAIGISNFFFAQSLILTYASLESQKMMTMNTQTMNQEEEKTKQLLLTNLGYSQSLITYQTLQN